MSEWAASVLDQLDRIAAFVFSDLRWMLWSRKRKRGIFVTATLIPGVCRVCGKDIPVTEPNSFHDTWRDYLQVHETCISAVVTHRDEHDVAEWFQIRGCKDLRWKPYAHLPRR